MAKVVVLYAASILSDKPTCYYGQLAQAFIDRGHSVLMINTLIGGFGLDIIEKKLSDEVIRFYPDLILSYNHVINEEIYSKTNCPVVAVEADTYDAFQNKDLLKKYREKLFLAIPNHSRFQLWKRNLPWIKDSHIITIKNSTLLKPEKIVQDINISCVATLIGVTKNNNIVKSMLNSSVVDRANMLKLLNRAEQNINDVSDEELHRFGFSYVDLMHYISFNNRARVLDNVGNLGLEVYGQFMGFDALVNLSDLFWSLRYDKIYTLEDNQDLYNRSKLSINIHFAHNIKKGIGSGYSWRVCDVMATNACLVSTECQAIRDDFGKWVNIPMFSDRHEAYDLCKKLLVEENWRKDIVAGSQLAIKEGGFSFYNRVKELEGIFNLKVNENYDDRYMRFITYNQKSTKLNQIRKGKVKLKELLIVCLVFIAPKSFLKKVYKTFSLLGFYPLTREEEIFTVTLYKKGLIKTLKGVWGNSLPK